jgi:hypothetical protein
MLARKDVTNMGYRLSQALRRVGVEAEFFFYGPKSPYEHKDQGTWFDSTESISEFPTEGEQMVLDYAEGADIVHIMNSIYHELLVWRSPMLKGKGVVISHTGTEYRDCYRRYNAVFNGLVDATLCPVDCLNKGGRNIKWLGSPVDTANIEPDYTFHDMTIAHYPTRPHKKGTDIITSLMDDVGGVTFKHSTEIVPWEDHVRRVSECDVYIDDMHSGVMNISTLDAAALGKIVITKYPLKNVKRYKKNFGVRPDILPVEDEYDLRTLMMYVISRSEAEILELKMKTRKWVETYHSYESVGKRLVNIYKEILDERSNTTT